MNSLRNRQAFGLHSSYLITSMFVCTLNGSSTGYCSTGSQPPRRLARHLQHLATQQGASMLVAPEVGVRPQSPLACPPPPASARAPLRRAAEEADSRLRDGRPVRRARGPDPSSSCAVPGACALRPWPQPGRCRVHHLHTSPRPHRRRDAHNGHRGDRGAHQERAQHHQGHSGRHETG